MNWSPRLPRFGLIHEMTIVALIVLGIVLAVFVWVNSLPAAGWGSGFGSSCSPCASGQCTVAPVPAAKLEWKPVPEDPDQVALMLGTVQLGNYDYSSNVYRPLERGQWGQKSKPPIAVPVRQKKSPCGKTGCDCGCPDGTCRCATEQAPAPDLPDWMTQGVTKENIAHREKVTICGREVTKDAALEAITASSSSLPEDAGKPFLVMVGDAATLAKVQADAAPLTGFRQKFYPPDAPMIKDRDGKILYTPGLWFTRADGTVLSYTATYPGLEKMTAASVEALRRADPNFDPSKAPDLTKPPPPPPSTKPAPVPGPEPMAPNYMPHACCAAAAAAFVYFLMKKKAA